MRRMTGLGTATALAALVVFAPKLQAQDGAGQVWIQIEARNSMAAAEERLLRWSAELPGVTGFRLSSGWIAVALGPFTPDEARTRLSELRMAGAIPADSYIPDNRLLRERIWTGPTAVPAPLGAPLAPVEAQPLGPTPTPAPQPPVSEPPGTEPPLVPLPQETPAQARAYEASLNREGRMEIQQALKWAGTYSSGIDGGFGPGTRAAISEWQGRNDYAPSGVLGAAQTAELVGAWKAEVQALGLQEVRDEEAGIAAMLPLGLVEFDRYAPPFVLYREKAKSGLELRLISQPGDQAGLEALYSSLLASGLVPPEGPRSLQGGGFTLSGMDAGIEVQARVALENGAIRGWMLRGARAESERNLRVMQSLAQDFRPLGTQVLDPGLVPIDEGLRARLQEGLTPKPPRAAVSGFYIDTTGAVMTSLPPLQDCRSLSLSGTTPAKMVWSDAALGLAVLRPDVALAPLRTAGFADTLPAAGAEVALGGFSFGAALALPSVSFGQLTAATAPDGSPAQATLGLTALPGDAGGVVLGPDGRVIGMLLPEAEVAGRALPEGVALMAQGPQILQRLAAAGTQVRPAAAGPALPPEDLSRMAADLAVQVICRD